MTRTHIAVILLGGVVAITGLLFLGCGSTPGGICGIGSDDVFVSYLFGSMGAALMVGGLVKGMGGRNAMGSAPLSGRSVITSVATGLVGVMVMALGLLFTCVNSWLVPGSAACGVGPLAALIAYSFGTVGAALVATGLLGRGAWRQHHSILGGSA